MEKKKIIIIGGGISGLSAGIYAEQHGLHAVILEKHYIPGGFCTGWDRKGFHIDGCVHWLTGTKDNTILNEMWKNLGAFKDEKDLLFLDSWGTFNYQGTQVTFYRDLDKAEKEWINISPIDTEMIKRFFKMVRDFTKVELPLDLPLNMIPFSRVLKLGLDVLSIWPSYLTTMSVHTDQFANKFKHPALRFALKNVQPGPGNLFSMIYSYATVVIGDGGVPKGGSRDMAFRMRDKFISLGGEFLINTEVEKVLVNGNKAVGVMLTNEKIIVGDYVVSCCDANYALTNLLPEKYQIRGISRKILKPKHYPTPSCCLLAFSVDKNIEIPTPYSFEVEPFDVAGLNISHLTIRNYRYDETFDRKDKTVITVLVDQYNFNYDFYNKLKDNKEEYQKFKANLAKEVESRIITRIPAYANNINLLDVATPWTLTRYTNATNGAYMGFLFTHKHPMYTHSGHIPGLKNFYLSGQWLQSPGGLPLAMTQGKFAIQRICKKERINHIFSPKFLTEIKKLKNI